MDNLAFDLLATDPESRVVISCAQQIRLIRTTSSHADQRQFMAMRARLRKDGEPIHIEQYPQVLRTKSTFSLLTIEVLDILRVFLQKQA